MARRQESDVVGTVLEAAGLEYTVHVGRKHVKVKWEMEGHKFSYSCAKTPSDWRALKNCHCSIRRILRAEGVSV